LIRRADAPRCSARRRPRDDVSVGGAPQGRPDARVLAEPLFLEGEVVKGFGRGSKLLGIPTGADLHPSPAGGPCLPAPKPRENPVATCTGKCSLHQNVGAPPKRRVGKPRAASQAVAARPRGTCAAGLTFAYPRRGEQRTWTKRRWRSSPNPSRTASTLGIPRALPAPRPPRLARGAEPCGAGRFATVDGVGPFEMVSSVGHNPYFANECSASPPRTLPAPRAPCAAPRVLRAASVGLVARCSEVRGAARRCRRVPRAPILTAPRQMLTAGRARSSRTSSTSSKTLAPAPAPEATSAPLGSAASVSGVRGERVAVAGVTRCGERLGRRGGRTSTGRGSAC
jgi:hypothetical protein